MSKGCISACSPSTRCANPNYKDTSECNYCCQTSECNEGDLESVYNNTRGGKLSSLGLEHVTNISTRPGFRVWLRCQDWVKSEFRYHKSNELQKHSVKLLCLGNVLRQILRWHIYVPTCLVSKMLKIYRRRNGSAFLGPVQSLILKIRSSQVVIPALPLL